MAKWQSVEGSPSPLGVHWIEAEQACNFALYSKHAAAVTLLLYREDDLVRPVVTHAFDPLRNKSGRVWHARLPRQAMGGAVYYAYRVDGPPPAGPFEWHQFNPRKILFDPFSETIFFPRSFDREAALGPEDNSGKAPLGVLWVTAADYDWDGDRRPRHEADLVIYELHVRGFTRNPNSGVTPGKPGTLAGLAEKIPYLKELGVTAVELMPVFEFDPASGDTWGYMPLSFFSPHSPYASRGEPGGDIAEFQDLVKALHRADIEVFLDAVYNHTGEGNEQGPTYSYKGIDNSTYYLADEPPERPYADFSGTGNTLNCANRHTRRLILSSLHHWVTRMHVDGFRFDLASVFARKEDGTLNFDDPPIFGQISGDPCFANVRLIAEPWDAAGAYQLGRGFPDTSWLQWNGQFRDDVRRFLRGDPGLVGRVMARLYGSDDLFPGTPFDAYHPYQSINFVTCHDGFTLYDLVAYNTKHNEANGHANADGTDYNWSWNCGHEGDEGAPPEVLALRRRQAKSFCTLLLLANGTPMLRAGDEFLQTQRGNNNPYNQDNETTWLDWSRRETFADVFRFFKLMIAFRKAHPSLCRSRFWRDDVRWVGVGPAVDFSDDSHSFAFALDGKRQQDRSLYVMINAWREPLRFEIQQSGPWARAIDTALDSPEDIAEVGRETPLSAAHYVVGPRSVVVLVSSA